MVDYSHGAIENMQTFDYGHGGKASDKKEVKAFDYGHGGEAPEVIDYGHGGDDKEKNAVPGKINFFCNIKKKYQSDKPKMSIFEQLG